MRRLIVRTCVRIVGGIIRPGIRVQTDVALARRMDDDHNSTITTCVGPNSEASALLYSCRAVLDTDTSALSSPKALQRAASSRPARGTDVERRRKARIGSERGSKMSRGTRGRTTLCTQLPSTAKYRASFGTTSKHREQSGVNSRVYA